MKLPAREGRASDLFGPTAAVSGQILVRGVYYDDESGVRAGAAYVFRDDGLGWVEEAKLLASDGAPGDRFGYSVAVVSGDRVVVGAHGDVEGESPARGSAYVFRHDASFRSDVAHDGSVDIYDLVWVKANVFNQGDGVLCP